VKAVVLARGKGTRMQRADGSAVMDPAQSRIADAGLKAMIPFRRPFLDYVLSALADAGCHDVCLVIGPEHELVRDYYERTHPPERVRVAFAVQMEARGTADAVLAAEAFAGDDPFLVLNSDNYYPVDVLHALTTLDRPGLPAFRRSALVQKSNIDPARVRSYAMLTIDDKGDLRDIVEKPDPETFARFGSAGDDVRVSMNCWQFARSIFAACRAVQPSSRGEVELPNAVRYAVRTMGERFRTIPVDAGVLDLSGREDIAEVERRLAHVDARP
jgi:glucose-1-phosphate thymidylyltransferase